MSNNPRDLVENPHAGVPSARNMAGAANADESLLGYGAINSRDSDDEVARRAYQLYQERQRKGEEGTADGDWFRAEEEVRRTRDSRNS
jgi:hypothetical protein